MTYEGLPKEDENVKDLGSCPNCFSEEVEQGHGWVAGLETYYKVCLNCSHTWDPE